MAGETKDINDLMQKHFDNAGIEDEGNDGTETGTEGQETQEQQQEEPSITDKLLDEATGTGNKSDDGNKQASGQEVTSADPAKVVVEKGKDKAKPKQEEKQQEQLQPGDIRGDDGSVIKAGAQRRHYENWKMEVQRREGFERNLGEAQREVTSLKARLETYEQNAKALGVSNPSDLGNAIRLYNDLRSNPVGTVQQVLAELKKQGHNIQGIGAGVDTRIVADLRTEIEQLRNSSHTPQQANEIADKEVETFYSQHPDARIHDTVLGAMAAKFPNKSNEQLYYDLRQEVINNGYDWTQPLEPQFRARQNGNQQQQQQQQQSQQQIKPAVNGRGATTVVEPKVTPSSPATARTDDIIRESMREAGYNI